MKQTEFPFSAEEHDPIIEFLVIVGNKNPSTPGRSRQQATGGVLLPTGDFTPFAFTDVAPSTSLALCFCIKEEASARHKCSNFLGGPEVDLITVYVHGREHVRIVGPHGIGAIPNPYVDGLVFGALLVGAKQTHLIIITEETGELDGESAAYNRICR